MVQEPFKHNAIFRFAYLRIGRQKTLSQNLQTHVKSAVTCFYLKKKVLLEDSHAHLFMHWPWMLCAIPA